MAIYKAIMQIPVFLSADNLDEARELLTGCRMDDFHREIAMGDWIGGEVRANNRDRGSRPPD